jgi:hypothetical protein
MTKSLKESQNLLAHNRRDEVFREHRLEGGMWARQGHGKGDCDEQSSAGEDEDQGEQIWWAFPIARGAKRDDENFFLIAKNV